MNVEALADVARTLERPIVLLPIEDYEPMAALIEREFPGVKYGWNEAVPEGLALIVHPLDSERIDVKVAQWCYDSDRMPFERRFIQCFPGPPVPPRRASDVLLASVA